MCKLKGISYLHLEWLNEYSLNTDALNGKQKLKKFKKTFERISDSPFDENYITVDRILNSTELFTVIHPRVTNNMKDKWQTSCNKVISKIMNFTKDKVA